MATGSTNQRLQRLRAGFDSYNRGDYEATVELVHPEVEVVRPGGLGVTVGREAALREMLPDAFEEQRLELHELSEHGDVAFAEVTQHVRGRGSGIEVSQRLWFVYRFEGPLIRRFEVHVGQEEALAALQRQGG